MHSDDVELGVGMAPKVQEKMRRKSVSSKAAEVVTIGECPLRFWWMRDLTDRCRSDPTGLGAQIECGQGSGGSTCFEENRHASGMSSSGDIAISKLTDRLEIV